MQLNVALKKLERINVTTDPKDVQNQTNTTANQMIMYSMLNEFNLNESVKPSNSSNGNVVYHTDYTGLGFISHIVNESSGIVYILDVLSMPDTEILYGVTPKPLTHVPVPGEMFGYVYQENYMVRAVRLDYEPNSDRQYSALFIDIGCVVRIGIESNDLYEVTQVAKSIPSYAKMCRLVQVPVNINIFDLLHTRIHYNVLCNDNSLMLIDVVSPGINPFAIEHQNEWNFYMYFFGNNLNKDIEATTELETDPLPPAYQLNDLNPFNNLMASTSNSPTFKINDDGASKPTENENTDEIIENDDIPDETNLIEFNPLQCNIKSITIKPLNGSFHPIDLDANLESNNNMSTSFDVTDNMFLEPKIMPAKSIQEVNVTRKPSTSTDYVKKKLKIGQHLRILYQHMVSVEEFYACLPRDLAYKMEVDRFSLLFNKKIYTRHLEPYTDDCRPKLYDKVVAMYNAADAKPAFYRAKVIAIVDTHVFRVYYVDYGNCATVRFSKMFKYDDMWDEYPEYVLHFRLNGVMECKAWDYDAKKGIEDIMRFECMATVVNIEHCEKLNRTTYIVDVLDVNRLDVAKTLIRKSLALPNEKASLTNPLQKHHSECDILYEETELM